LTFLSPFFQTYGFNSKFDQLFQLLKECDIIFKRRKI
jgi:hypothetical protein